MAQTPPVQYGVNLQATAKNAGASLIIERATNVGMSVGLTTVFSQASVKANQVYSYTDYLTNDGVTRYYRATETRTGSTAGVSSVVSSAPYDLSGGQA